MPYPKKRLHDGEKILLDVHPHPLFFLGPVVTVVVAIVFAIVSLMVFDDVAQTAASNVSIVVLGVGVVWLIGRYIRWRNTFFVVTNRRVISQSGVFTRDGIEIPIERVNTVSYRQSILARALGVGDIEIESGGEEGRQEFPDIRDAAGARRVITAQIQANRDRGVHHTPPTPLTTIADVTTQLERLEAMLDRGTLTWAEFEAQKHRLLSDLGDG